MKGTSTNITKYKYCDYKYKKKLDRIAGFIKICKKRTTGKHHFKESEHTATNTNVAMIFS